MAQGFPRLGEKQAALLLVNFDGDCRKRHCAVARIGRDGGSKYESHDVYEILGKVPVAQKHGLVP